MRVSKNMIAYLSCTLQDFYKFIGPKIRNDVQTITKSKKKELKLVCQECGIKSKELEAAHKLGRSRRDIIKIVLDDYESEEEKYLIPNLQKILERIKQEHLPVEDNFKFLCKPCHKKYDNIQKNYVPNKNIDQKIKQNKINDYQNEFSKLISKNKNLIHCLKELFLKFPDNIISTTQLKQIYEICYPNENSKKITDYVWSLANKDYFLENVGRSLYKLARKK